MKIKFHNNTGDKFYSELKFRVDELLFKRGVYKKRLNLLYGKAVFYYLLFFITYFLLYRIDHTRLMPLILHYVLIGISGVLLAFNVAHDATHGSFSRNKTINKILYYSTFNLNGTNAYLWGIRHKASHHIFPNVDGCDADIDDNPLIRLSPSKAYRWYHQYQAGYALIIYMIYTIHWVFFKDFLYLSKKKLANLQSIRHTARQKADIFLWKAVYILLYIAVPVWYGYPAGWVLLSFLFLHIAISLFFIFSLIVSHLSLETDFPVPDAENRLPYNYYQHQLATSLDYAASSKWVNLIFGGFNSHAAHHLFPSYPHTVYADISPVIQELAKKYGYKYNQLPWWRAIISHFRYLNKLGHGYGLKNNEKIQTGLAA